MKNLLSPLYLIYSDLKYHLQKALYVLPTHRWNISWAIRTSKRPLGGHNPILDDNKKLA